MAKRKMKQLALAVGAALGSLAAVPSAQAVNLATDGLGQVLIFPYYTTRADWTTLINITNTSNQVVAAKVRFHEAYNSRDVLDFTLILSPEDVWTAWVENGPDNIPVLRTNDNSCTVPQIPAGGQPFTTVTAGGQQVGGVLAYTGGAADGGPTGTDRLREGYVKVLMKGASPVAGLAAGAKHTAAGVPANCAALRAAFSTDNGVDAIRAAFPDYNQEINPLKGTFNLVNGPAGLTAGGEATALADFYRKPVGEPNLAATLQLPPSRAGSFAASFHEPNLNLANTMGRVLLPDGTTADNSLIDDPVTGANAVNFVLRRASVNNQWTRRTNPAEGWVTSSDWVVTMPTKRYYTDLATHEFAGRAAVRPGLPSGTPPSPFFRNPFITRSCDPVSYRIFDREEKPFVPDEGEPVFSPAPAPDAGDVLCYEANVITFDGSNVLGSAATITANIPTLPGVNGWMQLNFATDEAKPVVGFSITSRLTGNSALSEAFLVDHAYTR